MFGSLCLRLPKMASDQDEIKQRKDRSDGGDCDQRVVGTDIRMRRRRRWRGFLSHFADLGQRVEVICEADHTGAIFFRAFLPGTSRRRWNYRWGGLKGLTGWSRL